MIVEADGVQIPHWFCMCIIEICGSQRKEWSNLWTNGTMKFKSDIHRKYFWLSRHANSVSYSSCHPFVNIGPRTAYLAESSWLPLWFSFTLTLLDTRPLRGLPLPNKLHTSELFTMEINGMPYAISTQRMCLTFGFRRHEKKCRHFSKFNKQRPYKFSNVPRWIQEIHQLFLTRTTTPWVSCQQNHISKASPQGERKLCALN